MLKPLALAAALALAFVASARADIFTYVTPDGRRVIANRPPPDGARDVYTRPESRAPLVSGTGPVELPEAQPSGTSRPALSYVDHNPLIIAGHEVRRTDVWWKKHVVVWLENRSARTTARGVRVDVACYSGTGALLDTVSDHIAAIAPRSTRSASGIIVIDGYDAPTSVRCETRLAWTNAR